MRLGSGLTHQEQTEEPAQRKGNAFGKDVAFSFHFIPFRVRVTWHISFSSVWYNTSLSNVCRQLRVFPECFSLQVSMIVTWYTPVMVSATSAINRIRRTVLFLTEKDHIKIPFYLNYYLVLKELTLKNARQKPGCTFQVVVFPGVFHSHPRGQPRLHVCAREWKAQQYFFLAALLTAVLPFPAGLLVTGSVPLGHVLENVKSKWILLPCWPPLWG